MSKTVLYNCIYFMFFNKKLKDVLLCTYSTHIHVICEPRKVFFASMDFFIIFGTDITKESCFFLCFLYSKCTPKLNVGYCNNMSDSNL